jgi:spoIIIJ-associated protein
MDYWESYMKKLVELMGFSEYRVEIDAEHRHGLIFIYDNPTLIKENLVSLVESFNHVAQLVAKKENRPAIFFDLNNYRHEREGLIVELARAAAKKALATKKSISLPAMNSYERRLVHVELAIHPEVLTESIGKGRERYVIISPIEEKTLEKAKEVPQGVESESA